MSRFLFTTHWSQDLGHPVSSLPLAEELRRRGHEVAFCNPLDVPGALIREAGFPNLEPDFRDISIDHVETVPGTEEVWDVDHFASICGYLDESFVRQMVEVRLRLIRSFNADVVVDSFDLTSCIAARVLRKPLVTVIQSDLHPANPGYLWWKEKPADTPTVAPTLNAVLAGLGLEPIRKAADLLVGDLTLVIGTPETDPVPAGEDVLHLGLILHRQAETELPAWVDEFAGERPLIWVYYGNPSYGAGAEWADSIVIPRAVAEGLADHEARVLITTAFQEPAPLPESFRQVPFLPGLALARRSAVMIHHGGHNSCLTGAFAGTPAVIIPTFSERESNARRVADLGVADILLPTVDARGEKHLSGAVLRDRVDAMLSDSTWKKNAEKLSQKTQVSGRLEKAVDRIEQLA